MKLSLFTSARFLFSILFILSISVQIFAQDFRVVQDGIEYAEVTRGAPPEPVRINLLRLDLSKVRLDVVHAMDAAIGVEKTSSIAARHGAVAAVNAGFFRLDTSIFAGDAVGVLQIDGRLLSESYGNRIALGIINGKDKTEVDFAHLETKISLLAGIDSSFPISGINRERKADEIILFTPDFGRTTLTGTEGSEFILKTSAKNSLVGNIVQINEKKGSSLIPAHDFVISASGSKEKELTFFFKKPMSAARLNFQVKSLATEKQMFFSKVEDITNGVPQLIKNGRIEITWEAEKSSKAFVETRHPRTAVAKLKDGKFLMVTVDGRQPDRSVGMNLQELAEFLLEMGAVDAMNLDGGGSTTMFLGGKVVNKPSDQTGERRVSDALLVFPRAKNNK